MPFLWDLAQVSRVSGLKCTQRKKLLRASHFIEEDGIINEKSIYEPGTVDG